MKMHLLSAGLACVVISAQLFAGSRTKQWEEVEDALRQRLPATAVQRLEAITTAALAEKAYPEAIRADVRRIALDPTLDGLEAKIERLQAELGKSPAEMQPAMETILACWYWIYYQENRWKSGDRTAGGSGPDLRTWDVPRILTEIDRHFTAALATADALKAIPARDYDDILEPGTVSDDYRPTLYDVLAHQALSFYQAGEVGLAVGEDEFEIADSDPIFADTAGFLAWQPATTDRASPKLKAIQLFQQLLRFHEHDEKGAAFLDLELARIEYGHNVAVGDRVDERYLGALERFIAGAKRSEISTRALAAEARQLRKQDDLVRAHEVAERGSKSLPGSAGAAQCLNVIRQIEAPSASIAADTVWNAAGPILEVKYRNVAKVYFRAVPLDFVAAVKDRPGAVDPDDLDQLLARKPALAWSADLPPPKDFKESSERLPAPPSLPSGFYAIIASHDPGFSRADNQISVAAVWVSKLALVIRDDRGAGTLSGFVLEAQSGEPIAGATVRILHQESRKDDFETAVLTTDRDGRFEFVLKEQETYWVIAEHQGQMVANRPESYSYRVPDEQPNRRTLLFTDRAIYRPGQTIDYKGIAARFNQKAGRYGVESDRAVTVVFTDANGKEIARASHRTNDYGSFSGVFTAPRDRLLGAMTIRALDDDHGAVTFRVEEYKRPKFEVKLGPPAEPARLDGQVKVPGKATAYSGATIVGARVKWHVERETAFPRWCWWRPVAPAKSLAHGTATTAADGTFAVEFTAEPDRSLAVANEPEFFYKVSVDITDATGETRSDERTITLGYAALRAAVSSDAWLTPDQPVRLTVETTSLDGDPLPARGAVTVYALQQPAVVARQNMHRYGWGRSMLAPNEMPPVDPAIPLTWDLGEKVASRPFVTDKTGKTTVEVTLPAGIYRAVLETTDASGRKVTDRHELEVIDPSARHYGVRLAHQFVVRYNSVEPGDVMTAIWGTGYDRGRAFVEVMCDGRALQSYWTDPTRTQVTISQRVTEAMRGGLTLHVTYVRENRIYPEEQQIEVPWTNKQLSLRWERFRSKLDPGQKESWSLAVSGPDAKAAAAEMVATLYDASLDQFSKVDWPADFGVFRSERNLTTLDSTTDMADFRVRQFWPNRSERQPEWSYRTLRAELLPGPGAGRFLADNGDEETVVLSPFAVMTEGEGAGYQATETLAGTRVRTNLKDVASSISVVNKEFLEDIGATAPTDDGFDANGQNRVRDTKRLDAVVARRNLTETAFFFPRLRADRDGVVKLEFTMPEALTTWKFLAFAHDKKLRSGLLTDRVVTSKDLMVEPNPPRFLREGDAIEFTVKVTNLSDQPQTGTVRLALADAVTQQSADAALGNKTPAQVFALPAHGSRAYAWRVTVPDGMGFLTYKAVAASESFSDGEEGFLPVLSRLVLVTESLPLPIRGKTTRAFEFKKLVDSGGSDTLRNQSLTVQMVSQPAWYAVMALPYLMEFPHECSEQLFSRYYANTLAQHIVGSDPKIRRVFEQWKNTPALESPLSKNPELKAVMVEETPWLNDAKDETQARRNVALLFEPNRLNAEASEVLHKLTERQGPDGLWSWFPGGSTSEYISLDIVTGFGRLRHLGVGVDVAPAVKALAGLDAWIDRDYRERLAHPVAEEYAPSPAEALYLYARSFFLKDQPVEAKYREAADDLLRRAKTNWTKIGWRQSEAHLALALQRFGDEATARAIVKSLKERSVVDDELGRFWRGGSEDWWWWEAPIETQALTIEAFDEVGHDAQAVEECKVWLLKQKQTQGWPSTKATTDAIYALLLRGENLLGSDALVEVSLGGVPVKPEKVEAGTGFYEQKFAGPAIKPAMGHIAVKKSDAGPSWGAVHWQYLEDIAKVTPHAGTPLKVRKTLWIKETTAHGPVLKPVTGPVAVGDELVVRLELRTDRDMEFVHLKDQRGSGTEPVDVISSFQWQGGLGYYQTTRDTATHFFIDYLKSGTYVFEYSMRVQLRGHYQTGVAEIQCMYAPEFNSHSESVALEVE